jgi:hypothetical protein
MRGIAAGFPPLGFGAEDRANLSEAEDGGRRVRATRDALGLHSPGDGCGGQFLFHSAAFWKKCHPTWPKEPMCMCKEILQRRECPSGHHGSCRQGRNLDANRMDPQVIEAKLAPSLLQKGRFASIRFDKMGFRA